jgi:glucose-6-phosphate 1-dehydrogenase
MSTFRGTNALHRALSLLNAGFCWLALLGGAAAAAQTPPAVVLVGATGNLAGKYLWQALFDFQREGIVGHIYGGATRKPEEGSLTVAKMLNEKVKCPSDSDVDCAAALTSFKQEATYVQLKKEPHYEALGELLAESGHAKGGLLVYLSVSPDYYGAIAGYISRHFGAATSASWLRVVVEKPFGRDASSAKALSESIEASLKPEQVCKVDHYLGKQAVLGIGAFRAANPAYEPLLDAAHVAAVEVVMQETEDCEGRTWFYENYGALRDVHQNHLSEMLALLTGACMAGGRAW